MHLTGTKIRSRRCPPTAMRGQRGFTLIEVLAALAVLALTLGGMIGASAFYGANAVHLRDKTIAGWVAHNEMVEVQLSREWPRTGRSDGRVEMAGRDWRWQREVEKTPDDRLRRVTVRVGRDGDDEDNWLISLSGFFAQPGGGGAGPGGSFPGGPSAGPGPAGSNRVPGRTNTDSNQQDTGPTVGP